MPPCAATISSQTLSPTPMPPSRSVKKSSRARANAASLKPGPVSATSMRTRPPAGSPRNDAVSALQNLGFKPQVAADAVARAVEELGEEAGLNDLIRVALKRAAG